jgi:hypothetical protein
MFFAETSSMIQTNVQNNKEEEDNNTDVDQDNSTNECGGF